MICVNKLEETIEYILTKYPHESCNCLMSVNNIYVLLYSKYYPILRPLYPVVNYYELYNLRFMGKSYITDNKIDIFLGPCIEIVEILTHEERTIKDIIE